MLIMLQLVAGFSFFMYNFKMNNFIANTTGGDSQKLRIHYRFIFTNIIWTITFLIVCIKKPALFILYFMLTIFFVINFTLIPRIKPRELFFVSTISITHTLLLNFLLLSIFSFVYQLPIKDVVDSIEFFSISVIITAVFLFVVLVIFGKSKLAADIIRLAQTPNYSEMISVASLVLLASIIFDVGYFYSDKFISGQFAVNITTGIIYSIMFYYLLAYTVRFVNMNLYRRKTDELRDVYHRTIARRAIMESQVLLDGLTNLYNRKFMFETVAKLCATQKEGFVVMYIDVNGLKYVNDTFGHQSGDRYLQAVSYALMSSLREQDYAGRIGGDEFLVLLENIGHKDISIVENRIHDAIAIQNDLEKEFNMSASIGSLYVDSKMARHGPAYVLEEADNIMRKKKADFYAQKEVVS